MNTPGEGNGTETVTQARSRDGGRMNFLDILLVLGRKRRLISLVTLLALLLGLTDCLVTKPYYTATATILPPPQQSSSTALLGQSNALVSLGAASFGLTPAADLYVGVLQSSTIADRNIANFDLQKVYGRKTLVETRAALKGHVDIRTAKDGLIQISATDQDPHRASDLANGYVKELQAMNSGLAVTEAAQRRVFFDQRLEVERKALIEAEEDLLATEQHTGLIQVSGQAEMVIQTIAQLRGAIANRQVELQSLKTYATDQNHDVIRLQQEVATMQQQLTKLEDDRNRIQQPGNITVPAERVPKASLEYTRKLREVSRHETLYDLLSRQYEAASIDEAKSAPIIQVIDRAQAPDKKSGPKRLLLMIEFFVMGLASSAAWAFGENAYYRLQQVPEQAARLDALRALIPRFRHTLKT